MKVVTIVGARPQFIKAAPVSRALARAGFREFMVHTGQHYDRRMSQIFFEELGLAEPHVNLSIGSGSHGRQTGEMLCAAEAVLEAERPDVTLVYGDTNSTLAGALAACKMGIPLGHVEAGLRSFNREMPEEHNRVLTDHCADLLFCPTATAVSNLAREGIASGVHLVGDTMYDAILQFMPVARERSSILEQLDLRPKEYLLATVHRAGNADRPQNLGQILAALAAVEERVIFPVHPRTRRRIEELGGTHRLDFRTAKVDLIDPVGYLDMLVLEENARLILTDSGGAQKEAFFLGVPCVTLRDETEWVETVHNGWNVLVGANTDHMLAATRAFGPPAARPPEIFGDGSAAMRLVGLL